MGATDLMDLYLSREGFDGKVFRDIIANEHLLCHLSWIHTAE
jgi:hypothetical protein